MNEVKEDSAEKHDKRRRLTELRIWLSPRSPSGPRWAAPQEAEVGVRVLPVMQKHIQYSLLFIYVCWGE